MLFRYFRSQIHFPRGIKRRVRLRLAATSRSIAREVSGFGLQLSIRRRGRGGVVRRRGIVRRLLGCLAMRGRGVILRLAVALVIVGRGIGHGVVRENQRIVLDSVLDDLVLQELRGSQERLSSSSLLWVDGHAANRRRIY